MFGNIVATKIDLLAAQWSKIPTKQGARISTIMQL